MLDQVIPQSAGSLSVVLLALMMAIVQLVFIFRKPQLTSHGWGAAISFAGMLYAAGVFFEYNTLPGPINRFAGLLEFTAHVLLIHSLYGLTFACLGINGRRYHLFAGIFHILVLILLWSSTLIVSDRFVSHNFFWMAQPFTEPALGPLGSIFILYIAGAAIGNVFLWFKNKCRVERHRIGYLSGIIFWILLGIHDGLAALGMPTIQYIMEYGFFGFSAVVLWNVFDNYADLLAEDKYRVITEFTNDGILLIQNNKTVFENPACSALFGRPVNDLRTRDFLDHVIKEDKKKLTAYYDRLQDGGAADGLLITRIRRQNGEEKILEIQASMITYRNRPAILTVMCDITERIREEAALKDREEKLLRLKKMESLALLAGGVAHDLNNVLSGIVSYPDLMLLDLPQDSKLRRPLKPSGNPGSGPQLSSRIY
jgi:PAS domain S-box-containing protein